MTSTKASVGRSLFRFLRALLLGYVIAAALIYFIQRRLVYLPSTGDVTVLRGTAAGLVRVGEIPAGDSPIALTTGDFDGDGFTDVVVANLNSGNVTVLAPPRTEPRRNADETRS